MRFEKEVQDQYLTYSSLGNRVAAKLSLYGKQPFLPELCDLMGTGKVTGAETLGTVEISVNQIIGVAGACGKDSYTTDFLPIASADSSFADTWREIYSDCLNEKEISPISCYEYCGQFYVIDGKKRVSVMKCQGASLMKANVIRVLPTDKDCKEPIAHYSFLESYQKTGLYQVCPCSKYTFEDLQTAMGHEKDYVWTNQDRYFMLFTLSTVECALKLCKLNKLAVNPIDALMLLVENHSYQEVIRMSSWQMAKCFKANKEALLSLCAPEQKTIQQIA